MVILLPKRLKIRRKPKILIKAQRDLSKLTRTVIIDKNGHKKAVYVSMGILEKQKNKEVRDNRVEESKNTDADREKSLSIHALKKECYLYAREHFQGRKFTNKATGRVIIVSKDGLGEWKSKSKSREQVLSVKILDKLLENALFDHEAVDKHGRKNIDKISYFHSSCVINNNKYNAVITIVKIKNFGDKYYHHYLEDIKIEPCSGITRPAGETG